MKVLKSLLILVLFGFIVACSSAKEVAKYQAERAKYEAEKSRYENVSKQRSVAANSDSELDRNVRDLPQ